MSEVLAELALRAERRKLQDEFGMKVESNNLNRQIMYRDRDTGRVTAQCVRYGPDGREEVLGYYPLPNAR